MTTGPQHYAAAERLLAEADTIARPYDEGPCEADRVIAAAQVHATLALAAATAAQIIIQVPDSREGDDWAEVLAEPRDEDDDACYAGAGAPMAQPGPEPLFAPPAEPQS